MRFAQFIPVAFFRMLEATSFAQWAKSGLVFPVVETIHLMALGMLIGAIFIVDLRLLGFGMRRQSPSQLARELAPWTWVAIGLMICTGLVLFLSEAVRCSRNTCFFYKMVLLVAALSVHFLLVRKATKPSATAGGGMEKLVGALSLLLWVGVALAGRSIAFLGSSSVVTFK